MGIKADNGTRILILVFGVLGLMLLLRMLPFEGVPDPGRPGTLRDSGATGKDSVKRRLMKADTMEIEQAGAGRRRH